MAVVAGVLFNMPANADPGPACPGLQAAYVANPLARASLLPILQSNSCSIPTSSTSSSSSTSTTSSPTTSTSTTSTTVPGSASFCGALSASYLANPAAQSQLLPLFAASGCAVPGVTTTTAAPATTTTTVQATTTTTIPATTTTSTTVAPTTTACQSLQAAYVANPVARGSLLPALVANGCTVPSVTA